MAQVLISATVRDAKTIGSARVRNKQTVGILINDTGLSLTDIIDHHDEFLTTLDGVTDGVIEGSSITVYPALPAGLKSTAVAGSDVQEGGNYSFTVIGSRYADSVRVPASKSTLFGADGQSIANSGAAATFITFLLGGGTSAHRATDKAGVNYDEFIAAKKSFRK